MTIFEANQRSVIFETSSGDPDFEVQTRKILFEVDDRKVEFGSPFQAGSTGEANTAANVGAGAGEVFRDKVGATLNLRTIAGTGGLVASVNGDVVEIDGSAIAPITDHGALSGLADDDHPQYRDGSLVYTGDLDMGTNAIVNVGLVDGVDVSSHAARHENGGADEINLAGLSGLLADPQTPIAHAATHQNGGSDPINVTGLSGLLADPQTPLAHASTHEQGGADEISVTGLSGLLSDPQTPLAHAASHSDGGADEINAGDLGSGAAANGTVLTADGAGGNTYTVVATSDELVAVSATDTTPGYLLAKLAAGNAITLSLLGGGGDEDAEIAVDESAISHLNISDIGSNSHAAIDSHIADASIHFTEASIDHTAILNVGTNTHAQIDSHIADASIHFTEASIDHGSISGLADDDHSQYFLLAGRSGGQTAYGSPTNGQNLTLGGNPGANPGFINMNSPVVFGPYNGNPSATYGFSYTATENFTAPFVGGGLNFSGTISIGSGTFIYESFRGAPTITTNSNLGFAAYTVLQALPRLVAGSGAAHNPLAPLILNAGPQIANPQVGARTTATAAAVNWAPQLRGEVSGASMTVTNLTGFTNQPVWNTVAGSTISFGTVRGFWARTPSVALFGSSAGIETMVAYYAIDVDNLGTFGGTAPVAALRSAITAGTNQFCILNNGGAPIDMGGGEIVDVSRVQCFVDNNGLQLGAGSDLLINWNGTGLEFDPVTGDDMRITFATGVHTITSSNASPELRLDYDRINVGAGGSVGNQTRVYTSPSRTTTVPGEWADDLHTAAGNLTVDDSMGAIYGLVYNSQSLTIGTGAITGPVATLNIGGQTTSALDSATSTQAVRVTGRTTLRGHLSLDELTPGTLTGNVNDYSPATGNSARGAWRLATDDLGARTITGLAVLTPVETSDVIWITNVGTVDNIVFSHQDAASAAANRIISPTGANYTLGPGESLAIRYDQTTTRWRILYGSGT